MVAVEGYGQGAQGAVRVHVNDGVEHVDYLDIAFHGTYEGFGARSCGGEVSEDGRCEGTPCGGYTKDGGGGASRLFVRDEDVVYVSQIGGCALEDCDKCQGLACAVDSNRLQSEGPGTFTDVTRHKGEGAACVATISACEGKNVLPELSGEVGDGHW